MFDKTPYYINDEGTKFWYDESLTDYAKRGNRNGTTLDDIIVWIVETSDGKRTRLIVDTTNGSILFENVRTEDLAVHIDIMKIDKEYNDNK